MVCTRETVGSTTQMRRVVVAAMSSQLFVWIFIMTGGLGGECHRVARIYVNGQSVQSCASTEISLAQTRLAVK